MRQEMRCLFLFIALCASGAMGDEEETTLAPELPLEVEPVLEPVVEVIAEPIEEGPPPAPASSKPHSTLFNKPGDSPYLKYNTLATRMTLFTNSSGETGTLLVAGDQDSIDSLTIFEPELMSRVIIHGASDGISTTGWMNVMKKKLLDVENSNIILVDWSKGASVSDTNQLLTNARMLGTHVTWVLEQLIAKKSAKPENIHLIVHGCASFAADIVGREVKGLGRITGLDPGGPSFDKLPVDLRLDRSDATFVDVIHTDAQNASRSWYGRGTSLPVGHLDFYPNDGHAQPGCSIQRFSDLVTRPIPEGIRLFVACHHYRAIDYFLESIEPKGTCRMLAYKCRSADDFLAGKCADCGADGSGCAEMGFNSLTYHKTDIVDDRTMFLTTNSRMPYCQHHYGLKIALAKNRYQVRGGVLLLEAKGETGSMETRFNGGLTGLKSGETIHFVALNEKDIGPLKTMSMAWIPAPTINLFTGPALRINKVEFARLSISQGDRKEDEVMLLCPQNSTIISPFFRKTFSVAVRNTC